MVRALAFVFAVAGAPLLLTAVTGCTGASTRDNDANKADGGSQNDALLGDATAPDGAGAADGAAGLDGPPAQCTDTTRLVQASSYDQSCVRNADCVGVGEGYACQCETVFCVTAAINSSAYAQWASDVGSAAYTSNPANPRGCGCPTGNTCCSGGKCLWGGQCNATPDASVADADEAGLGAEAGDAGAE